MTKQKKNLQKLVKKRQQLQQVTKTTSPDSATTSESVVAALPATPVLAALPADTHIIREISRTLISFVFILALLSVAIIIDNRTPFLGNLGDQLFSFLRLN